LVFAQRIPICIFRGKKGEYPMNFDGIIALGKAFKSVRTRQQQNTPSDLMEKIKKLKTVRESGHDSLWNRVRYE
jgi:hypothetical protein